MSRIWIALLIVVPLFSIALGVYLVSPTPPRPTPVLVAHSERSAGASTPPAKEQPAAPKPQPAAKPAAAIPTPIPQAMTTEPSPADFTAFANRFCKSMVTYKDEQEKANAVSLKQRHGISEPTATYSMSLVSIDKQATTSLLNPVVWVMVTRQNNDYGGTLIGYKGTYNFSWQGGRFVGLASTMVQDFPQVGPTISFDASVVDDVAQKSK